MTLASPSPDAERVRPQFARLRHVLEASLDRLLPDSRPILSMGMSGDFHVAIEEGSDACAGRKCCFWPSIIWDDEIGHNTVILLQGQPSRTDYLTHFIGFPSNPN